MAAARLKSMKSCVLLSSAPKPDSHWAIFSTELFLADEDPLVYLDEKLLLEVWVT